MCPSTWQDPVLGPEEADSAHCGHEGPTPWASTPREQTACSARAPAGQHGLPRPSCSRVVWVADCPLPSTLKSRLMVALGSASCCGYLDCTQVAFGFCGPPPAATRFPGPAGGFSWTLLWSACWRLWLPVVGAAGRAPKFPAVPGSGFRVLPLLTGSQASRSLLALTVPSQLRGLPGSGKVAIGCWLSALVSLK